MYKNGKNYIYLLIGCHLLLYKYCIKWFLKQMNACVMEDIIIIIVSNLIAVIPI